MGFWHILLFILPEKVEGCNSWVESREVIWVIWVFSKIFVTPEIQDPRLFGGEDSNSWQLTDGDMRCRVWRVSMWGIRR